MAVTISVATILANTAQLISVPPFSSPLAPQGTNVTETQAIAWLQQSLESLQALNAQKLGADKHHISSISLLTQANVNFLSLPSEAIELFDVLWVRSPDKVYRLLPAESNYVLPLGSHVGPWTDVPPKFQLEGTTLVFFPTPSEPYRVSLWYGQAFSMPSVTSTVQGRLDWQKWLELDLACTCLTRKRRAADLAEMTGKRDALSVQLFSPGRQRMRAGPVRMQDVECEIFRSWED